MIVIRGDEHDEAMQAELRGSVVLIRSRGAASGVSQPVQSVMRAALQRAEVHLGRSYHRIFQRLRFTIPMALAPMLAQTST